MVPENTTAKAKAWLDRVGKKRGSYHEVNKDEGILYEVGDRAEAVSSNSSILNTKSAFVATDLDAVQPPLPRRRKSRWNPLRRWGEQSNGWHVGLMLGAFLATAVLVVNIVLLIFTSTAYSFEQSGIINLHTGSCSQARSAGRWIHLAINILSTALLGASNYSMQVLSSPTRKEVDNAHATGSALDIGVQSFRNLFKIGFKRRILWFILAFSSIPLHLMYNSVVFEAISANEYYVFFVTPEFLQGSAWNDTIIEKPTFIGMGWDIEKSDVESRLRNFQQNVTQTQQIDLADTLAIYSNAFLTNRGDLLMVVANNTSKLNSSVLGYTAASPQMSRYGDERSGGHTNYWMCSDIQTTDGTGAETWTCDPSKLSANDWTVLGHRPEYFLSAETDEKCQLLMSEAIMIIVIICNACKVFAMMVTLLSGFRNPLVTVGDAAASFLSDSDAHTERLCLIQKGDIRRYRNAIYLIRSSTLKPGFDPALMAASSTKLVISSAPQLSRRLQNNDAPNIHRPRQYLPRSMIWARTVSKARWLLCVGLGILALIMASILLGRGIESLHQFGLPTDASALWHLGFGALNANMLVSLNNSTYFATPSHTVGFILLANSPQLIFSFLYLLYNNIYTSLAQAAEWADFAIDRKPLRVTTPRGQQRSTYWLHLPYRYAIPLMVASGIMHWFISQSLFLARIQRRTIPIDDAPPINNTSVTCGYSVIPIICSISLGGLMLVFVVALGLSRSIEGKMPFMGSCSAVISACCHRNLDEDRDVALKPVMWGAVDVPPRVDCESEKAEEEEGHCTFSSGVVSQPVPGRCMYKASASSSGQRERSEKDFITTSIRDERFKAADNTGANSIVKPTALVFSRIRSPGPAQGQF
ncbi:MAG: hypothetical protein Q9227_008179 [Pyrenula ochraceoflavens]